MLELKRHGKTIDDLKRYSADYTMPGRQSHGDSPSRGDAMRARVCPAVPRSNTRWTVTHRSSYGGVSSAPAVSRRPGPCEWPCNGARASEAVHGGARWCVSGKLGPSSLPDTDTPTPPSCYWVCMYACADGDAGLQTSQCTRTRVRTQGGLADLNLAQRLHANNGQRGAEHETSGGLCTTTAGGVWRPACGHAYTTQNASVFVILPPL